MKITVQADLNIAATTYLLERDGAAFRTFLAEEMSLVSYDITECWKEGSSTLVKIISKPDVSAWIPGSLAKSIPEKLEYWDVVAYDPAKLVQPPYELTIRSEAPFLGDKGMFESRTIIEPLGPERCRHVLEQRIEFKGLFGLGSVAKKLAKKSLQQSFDEMPSLIDKWVEVRQELLQTRHGRERLLAGRPKVEGVPWMQEQVEAIRRASLRQSSSKKQRPSASRQPQAQDGVASIKARAGLQPASVDEPGSSAAEAPVLAAASMPAPLPSAFAAAAAGATAAVAAEGQQQAVAQSGSADRGVVGAGASAGGPVAGQGDGNAASQAAGGRGSPSLPQAEPPQAGMPQEEEEAEEGHYFDAREAPSRQTTGATAYLTPEASLAAPADAELAPAASPAAVDALAAAGHRLDEAAQQQQQQRVHVERLEQLEEGAGDDRSSASYAADRSSSEESEWEGEEAWSSSNPWRAYYQQHGLTPLRRDRSLPAPLVKKFIPKRRPQPVQAQPLGAGSQQRGSGGGKRRWRQGRGILALCGGHSHTSE